MNTESNLEFITSITICPSDIRKVEKHLEMAQTHLKPLRNILFTPLFAAPESVDRVHSMSDDGSRVMLDSGGYYVQIGRIKYEELYLPLLNFYKSNRWAAAYTLPDHVPLSTDSPETVERKVRNTIINSTLFFQELPDELKGKAMPVVHGHSYSQIDACLEAYINLGVSRIGFGSFGTGGAKGEINVPRNDSMELVRHVIKVAHKHGIKVHCFGLGVPALGAMLKGINADSFDSASWLKSAGFGQVFLPFMRSYNVSYRYTVSELQKGITLEKFREWSILTGHRCSLCESFHELQRSKMYRAAHNLVVMSETVEMVNAGNQALIQNIYRQGSSKYRDEFTKWLA